jgi:SAM-dependent methyltransferase
VGELPEEFTSELAAQALSYLSHSDPMLQSGFGGGPERWRQEREPILDAVNRSGAFIDIGCANGYLLQCLIDWGRGRNLALTPYGVDFSPELIALARQRFRGFESNFFVGNARSWTPPRRFDFVYSLYDNVPADYLGSYVEHLLHEVVAPHGRLILGAYGSRTRQQPAFDVAQFLSGNGFPVGGAVVVGGLPEARFAWIEAP